VGFAFYSRFPCFISGLPALFAIFRSFHDLFVIYLRFIRGFCVLFVVFAFFSQFSCFNSGLRVLFAIYLRFSLFIRDSFAVDLRFIRGFRAIIAIYVFHSLFIRDFL
jgi:hypothetical protein